MKPRWLLALVLPLCLVSLALADDQADQKDLETGTWKVVAMSRNGKELPKADLEKLDFTFTFKGDKFTVMATGQTKQGMFKIDSSKKPKEMNLKVEKDDDKAIYEIEKDSLKIAFGMKERPKDFKGGADVIVFTFERKK